MTTNELYEALAALTAIDAPAGFEEPLIRFARESFAPLVDDIRIDVRGNLYAVRKGTSASAPTVMVVAHGDEIGFMVTRITDEGFLRFVKIGGPTDMVLPGRPVRVLCAKGPLPGIIGVRPGHLISGDDARRIPPVGELYIDIGAENRGEAERWGVETGIPVVFDGPLTRFPNIPVRVFGKAVDDRAGVLALIETARALRAVKLAATVVWCISVEEEIGLRGAAVAAMNIKPDVVIAVDTAPAGGTPDVAPDEIPWRIGDGPLLKVRETRGLSTHGPLRRLMRECADRASIPYQLVVDTAGLTDATSAQQADAGIAAMSLCLPRRYSHSPAELLDIRDLEALIALLRAVLPELVDRSALMRV